MATANDEQNKLVLSTDDVVRILRASAKCGVQELKYLGLEVKFGQPAEPGDLPDRPNQQRAHESTVAEMTDHQHTEVSKESQEQMELDLREAQLEELKLTNPSEFEDMVISGELEDDDPNESTGDDGFE